MPDFLVHDLFAVGRILTACLPPSERLRVAASMVHVIRLRAAAGRYGPTEAPDAGRSLVVDLERLESSIRRASRPDRANAVRASVARVMVHMVIARRRHGDYAPSRRRVAWPFSEN